MSNPLRRFFEQEAANKQHYGRQSGVRSILSGRSGAAKGAPRQATTVTTLGGNGKVHTSPQPPRQPRPPSAPTGPAPSPSRSNRTVGVRTRRAAAATASYTSPSPPRQPRAVGSISNLYLSSPNVPAVATQPSLESPVALHLARTPPPHPAATSAIALDHSASWTTSPFIPRSRDPANVSMPATTSSSSSAPTQPTARGSSARMRLVGPTPATPPQSILQVRAPATGSPAKPAPTFRAKRYVHSVSPPPQARYVSPSPPRTSRQLSTAQAHTPAAASSRTASQQQQPPSAQVSSTSAAANIRHTSSTAVRITKDAQLVRQSISAAASAGSAALRQHIDRDGGGGAAAPSAPPSNTATARSSMVRFVEDNAVDSSSMHAGDADRAATDSTRRQQQQQCSRAASLQQQSLPQAAPSASTNTTRRHSDAYSATAASSPTGGASSGPFSPPSSMRHAPYPEEKSGASLILEDSANEAHDRLAGYQIGKVIGEGGFCVVKLGHHEISGRPVAIKVINKAALKHSHDWRRVGREIRILKRLKNNPAIIHVYDVISLPSQVYLVQELAEGGSLLDFVRSRKRLSEDVAVRFFLQVVAGLQSCHANEVVHRDIKLENLLMDAANNMKIIDFGLAAVFTPDRLLKVHCGSPSYAAPEIVGRQLYEGPPCDVWSLGVVTFAMVCGHLPFFSRNGRSELSQKILAGRYHAPDYMSDRMKDLIARMLTLDPQRRLTLDQVWTHPWITGSLASRTFQLPAPLLVRHAKTGAISPDARLLSYMDQLGVDCAAVCNDLDANECNQLTATYFLLAEAFQSTGALPSISAAAREIGARLVKRSQSMHSMHGFSLDVNEEGDRDDSAHFAPSKPRR